MTQRNGMQKFKLKKDIRNEIDCEWNALYCQLIGWRKNKKP